jgi:diguanylate cyclase (GGDEF)-like protein
VISITASLTSLFNRRYFDNTFLRQYRITKRNKESLIFVMCDIDYFKQYNDIYGHNKGDEALRRIAKVFQSSLHRPDDYAFRLGGEEFGLIFSNTDEKKALEFVNKIRTKIEKLHIRHEYNKASRYLTISMGLVYYAHKIVRDTKELYVFADKALYFSKDKGRNQVTSLNIDNSETPLTQDNIAEYFCNKYKSIS